MKFNSANKFSAPVGASFIILSSFFYASYGVWTKLMGNFFGGYTASALRSILVFLILIPIAFYYRKFQPLQLKQNWLYILGMIITSFFTWGPLYFAILEAGVGISLTVAYASIVLGMMLFGFIFANEQITKDKFFSAVLGLIGLILIFSPSVSNFAWVALAAALISGLSSGGNAVIAKKIHYNSSQTTVVVWATSIIANVIMALLISEPLPRFNFQIEWIYLILFSLASIVASWSLVKGVKLIDAGAAGILGLLEIVFSVAFGILFFHEKLTLITLLGAIIIVLAAAIPYLRPLRKL